MAGIRSKACSCACGGGGAVAAAFDRAIARSGVPASITVDHCTECTSRALEDCAYQGGVKRYSLRTVEPTETVHIESSIGRCVTSV
jgi:hypothetical protein